MAKHAKHARTDKEEQAVEVESRQGERSVEEGEGAQQPLLAPEHPAAAHHKASKRMRIVLIAVSIVLVLLIAALGYFAWMLVDEARDVAYQSAAQTAKVEKDSSAPASDAGKGAGARKEAPKLVELIGKTQDEAAAEIGRGATETSSKDITEEKGEGDEKTTEVVGRSVTLALTDETTDARGNIPSVYLTLDADGVIVEAGYSASVGSLGYGDVSFIDAVSSEHIVENLVETAGVDIEQGSVEMPAVEDYRTYADDGTTIAQEVYTFSGDDSGSGDATYSWSCKLSYDYSAANVSGNLADTIRQVYVYIKVAS